MKVVAAGEGVEDAEEGGGSVAQVQTYSRRRRLHHPLHHHQHSITFVILTLTNQPGDDDHEQAVLSLPVSEAHIAGVFKCEAKHAETSKSLFNVTKIDVQCNHFDDDDYDDRGDCGDGDSCDDDDGK